MRALALAVLALGLAGSCAQKTSPAAPPGPKLVAVPFGTVRPATDRAVVFVEVVATPESRGRGLGGRASLPPDTGMLFVYAHPDQRNYWMKDCSLALDIAFLDRERRITNVETLPPGAGLPDSEISHAASKGPALYVLETPAGWMAGHGVGAGDEVDLSAALRGVDPR